MTPRIILRALLLLCFPALAVLTAFSQSVTVSPTTVAFGNQAQGSASSVHKVTLKNGQTSAITISSITTSPSDYSQTNTCPLSPATLAAGASCTISITFTPSMQGSINGTLTVVDSGLSSPQIGTLTGTGTAPILQSISVTPTTASIIVGQSQQFTATGTYSDGSTQNLTTTASWKSSSTATATVGLHTGLAKSVAAGSATMTASLGTVNGSATLTVAAVTLTSIAVTPATASIAAGKTKQYTATGTYNNGTTQILTSTAAWTSSATSIATVNAGLATGVAPGSATITATSGTISGSAAITVTAATLTSIAVTPSSASIGVGANQQFVATGTYSDGTTQILTTTASWVSSATSIATVGLHTGLAKGIATGSATITASLGTVKGTATLTVAPTLKSITVTPSNPTIAKGTTQQFVATGNYSDGSTQNLTGTATWSSSNPAVATIAAGGLATGTSVGSVTITATSGSVSGTTTLNVGAAVLVSIAVTPANPSFALGTTLSLFATGTYSDGSTLDLTTTATWSTGNGAVATVNAQGVARSVALGSTVATATSAAISGSTTITVTPATLVSIAVTPAIPAIAAGTTQQFTATGTYTDGTTQNITGSVQWTSGTPAVATISSGATNPGLATAVEQGTATITATSGSITGSTTLTVTAAALVSIAINPASPAIAMGTTQQFTATGTYTDGTTQNLTTTVQWSSDTPVVATISNSSGSAGLATSVGQGTATISAASGSVTGSTTLTVTSATLVSIAVNPPTATVPLGTTQQFNATGTFTDGTTQDLTQSGHWSSTAATVATISNTADTAGLATTLGTGTTTISITSGAITGSATLVVNPAALVSIAITPQNPTIVLGATQQFAATGTYTDGTTQDLTSVATWTSSNASVAVISNAVGSDGLATSSGQGTTTIAATSNSISGSTTLAVTVAGPTLVSITINPSTATISLGANQPFTATGNYSDGSTLDLTTSSTWSSSNTGVATVSNAAGTQGLASATGPGTASISATTSSIIGSASLTVNVPTLVSIAISPQSPTVPFPGTLQFTATGTYSDGSTQNITNSVTWTSDTQAVATISNSSGSQGLATSVGVGTATIAASLSSVSSSTVLTVTLSSNPQTWSLHGPPGRSSHSAVYDPNSQQMIIFGGKEAGLNIGLNDVWLGVISTSQDESFTAEMPTGTAPPARYGHAATYDPTSNRMTIFGGSLGASLCANDVWILSGANGQTGPPAWINATPSGAQPQPRSYTDGVYDPNTNSLIVFGGNNCSTGYFSDVWVLSGANGEAGTPTWTQLNPSGAAPLPRESSTAVYDSKNNILIVYGGDSGGLIFSDVWVLSNANGTGGTPVWTQLSPTGTIPTARTGHTAIFDSVNDRMTIFGGSNRSGVTLSDTWVLTTANGVGGTPAWLQIPVQGTAPNVAYHSAVYDQAKNNMYVFAGASSQDKLQANNHAFVLNGANGISSGGQKWILTGPAVRYSHSAFYDSATNSLFVFAGQHSSSNTNFGDYWQESPALGSTNLNWTLLTSKGSKPSSRFGHTGLYDSASNRMMVFGGATGFPAPCVNDYYVLEQANTQGGGLTWLSLVPTGTAPAVRTLHTSVYDANTNTLIIFGGYDCHNTYYNDVWILSNANDVTGQPAWTRLQPAGPLPSARESSSAIYDRTTNSLIVYGGDSGGAPFGDIWILSNANGSGGTPVWTQLSPSNSGPVPRSGQTATYDSVNNVMPIYGGFDGKNVLSDAWVLSGANGQAGTATWNQLPSGQPRRFHTSEYDPSSNQMITYGGASAITPQAPSSDIYTLTDANDVP